MTFLDSPHRYLLVNIDQHKCLCSINLPVREGTAAEKGNLPIPRRKQILGTYYKNTVGTLFPAIHSPERKGIERITVYQGFLT